MTDTSFTCAAFNADDLAPMTRQDDSDSIPVFLGSPSSSSWSVSDIASDLLSPAPRSGKPETECTVLDNAQRAVQVENLDIHKRSTFYFDDGSVTLKVGVYHGLDRALNLRISGRGRVFPGPRPHLPARVRRG
jgi:hypothetical protein